MKFKVSILNFLMLAALSFVPLHIAYSQTASILPPAKTTYLDKNGKPLAFGTVDFYIPGTTTPKTTWQDAGQTIPNTNPVVLDNAGRSIVLGDGSYRQIVKDKNGNVIWDQVTSSTGSGGGGGGTPTVGDGDPVGIVKAWSGFIAPYQYAFAYGQEFVRTSYPELFQAITYQTNVTCTTGSPTLTSISDTSQLAIGTPIESSCLNSGATIVSKTTSTIVASSNAIISTTTTARFFPYGNGDGSSTFNLPDLRGKVIAGRDNMGGIPANTLSDPLGLGKSGGSQTSTLIRSDLPNVAPTFSGTPMTATGSLPGVVTAGGTIQTNAGPGTSGVYGLSGAVGVGTSFTTNSFTPNGTIQSLNGGVTQTDVSIVQPTQIYNYIIKILPDSNPNTFFGVASIGGMYGVIECGFGLTCVGNTITATSSVDIPPPTLTTLGGVFQYDCGSSKWVYSVDSNGALGCSQPNFTDLAGTILLSQITNNSLTNAKLAQSPAVTLKGNPTNTTSNVQDFTIASLGNLAVPSGTLDYIMIYDHATNTLKYVTPNQIAASGVAGVASFGGLTGIILNGDGIQIDSQTVYVGFPVSTISSTASVTGANKIVLCDATSGDVTLTIDSAANINNGETLTVKRIDNSINSCTVNVTGGGTIDNLTDLYIEPQYSSFTLASDGSSNWWIQ